MLVPSVMVDWALQTTYRIESDGFLYDFGSRMRRQLSEVFIGHETSCVPVFHGVRDTIASIRSQIKLYHDCSVVCGGLDTVNNGSIVLSGYSSEAVWRWQR